MPSIFPDRRAERRRRMRGPRSGNLSRG
jgi:hypothetical protein